MNDMSKVIEPKSDQLNADDLLTGPRTITVRDVTIRPGTEQPVSIFYEGDNNKPYKCCKSMARVLVSAWGADASKYIGRSMTLYCDPKVKWGGMEVGGIRISHLSNIDRKTVMALTATKGKKAPFIVEPLVMPQNKPKAASEQEKANAEVPSEGGSVEWIWIAPNGKSRRFHNSAAWLEALRSGLATKSAEDCTQLMSRMNDMFNALMEHDRSAVEEAQAMINERFIEASNV